VTVNSITPPPSSFTLSSFEDDVAVHQSSGVTTTQQRYMVHACLGMAECCPKDVMDVALLLHHHDLCQPDPQGNVPLHLAIIQYGMTMMHQARSSETNKNDRDRKRTRRRTMLKQVLEAWPQAASRANHKHELPLHLALQQGCDPDMIALIFIAYPAACSVALVHTVMSPVLLHHHSRSITHTHTHPHPHPTSSSSSSSCSSFWECTVGCSLARPCLMEHVPFYPFTMAAMMAVVVATEADASRQSWPNIEMINHTTAATTLQGSQSLTLTTDSAAMCFSALDTIYMLLRACPEPERFVN
jgi:hypothetical protein